LIRELKDTGVSSDLSELITLKNVEETMVNVGISSSITET
jgi:hypothetical protein